MTKMMKGGSARALLCVLAVTVLTPSVAQAQDILMRRPIIVKKSSGTGNPPATPAPSDPDVIDPGLVCDANAPRRTIDAQWLAETHTGTTDAASNCVNTTTTYHCSVVTVCAVGGTETPIVSEASDATCEQYFKDRGPIYAPAT